MFRVRAYAAPMVPELLPTLERDAIHATMPSVSAAHAA